MKKKIALWLPELIGILIVASLLISLSLGTSVIGAESIKQKTAKVSIDVSDIEEPKTEIVSLGVFDVSAYCGENYPHICNDGDATVTATGTTPKAGRTISVDPNIIPYGTNVIIDGHTYIAEDCGGAINGNKIDLFFDKHQEALDFGIQQKEVFIERAINNEIP